MTTASTPAATATGTKRSAQDETEGDRAHAYQCTDALECPAEDIPFTELAKKILGYANIVDTVDETVGGKDILNLPDPIIKSTNIISKEKPWQDSGVVNASVNDAWISKNKNKIMLL